MNPEKYLEAPAFFPNSPVIIERERKVSFLEFNQESNRVAIIPLAL
jgi:hypothetical protein